ncbi:tetratricopeptide repeat protein [Thermaurantiacus sp.]
MAKPPANIPVRPENDSFIREVDEEYRRSEMEKFAATWGRWILLAVGLGLALFGAYLYWQGQKAKSAESASEKLSMALDRIAENRTGEADAPLAEVAAEGSPGQRSLARMAQAGLAANRGEPEAAIAALRAVEADATAPEPLRELARIRLLRMEFDTLSPDEVIARSKPFIEGDSPWFPAVAEMVGVAHLKAGRNKDAAAVFLRLAGTAEAPESQRARAEQMAASLGEDTTALAEKIEAQGAAAARAGS